MPKARSFLLLATLTLAAAPGELAQQHQAPPPGNTQSGMDLSRVPNGNSMDPQLDRAQAYQRKLLSEERRKRMLADAERLAALSEQVKNAVQAMAPGAVSNDVEAKTAEMSRLVRELGKLNRE